MYRARDLKLKHEVAINILPEKLAQDSDRVSRFQREAEVLASLNHPNIATIHHLEETEGKRYPVLELVEGETPDRIPRGPIPVEEDLDIAIQICEARHRDLKPANIKITSERQNQGSRRRIGEGFGKRATDMTASDSPALLSGTV